MRRYRKRPRVEAPVDDSSSSDDDSSSSSSKEKPDEGGNKDKETSYAFSSSSDDDDDEDDDDYKDDTGGSSQVQPLPLGSRPKRRKKKKTKKTTRNENNDKQTPARRRTRRNHVQNGHHRQVILNQQQRKAEDDRIEALIAQNRWAFCCSKCACSEEAKQKAHGLRYIVSGDYRFPHRPCCHKLDASRPPGMTWASTYETAEANASEAFRLQLQDEQFNTKSASEGSDNSESDYDTKPRAVCDRKNNNEEKNKSKQKQAHDQDGNVNLVDGKHIHKLYDNAKRQEKNLVNWSEARDTLLDLHTNPDYQVVVKAFLQLQQQQQQQAEQRNGAVVLDLFSGMGTAVVALKRLGVALEKVVHCERDKVATFVYQQHHNSQIDSGTEYVHYSRFEDIFSTAGLNDQAYNDFMDAHAPIDVVIGGPPCQDFTGINATRQGLDGTKGSYMIATGLLIQRMKCDARQQGRPLHYLLENVLIWNDKKLPLSDGDKEQILKALGCSWNPVELDAACFSPCTRLRSFFTNIRIPRWEIAKYEMDLSSNPTSVLRDGFRLAANIYEPDMLAKVPTFMASRSRLNDDRMRVFRRYDAVDGGKNVDDKDDNHKDDDNCKDDSDTDSHEDNNDHKAEDDDTRSNNNQVPEKTSARYEYRILTRSERLDLMGFSTHYLDCLDGLYESLLHNGHAMVASKHWRECLEPRYHTFQGALHGVSNPYDFVDVPTGDIDGGPPRCVEMRILPFWGSDPLNAQDYGKRLIGSAISVPVLEFCLKELAQLFPSRQYDGYDYKFAWRR